MAFFIKRSIYTLIQSVLNVTQLLPKQMYIENVVTVMKRELLDECDYVREAECNLKFAQLLKDGI